MGVVDRENIIDGSTIKPGDKIIGLPSSGVHSNGFSMVRKLFFDMKGHDLSDMLEGLDRPLGEILLEPTRLYVKSLMRAIESGIKVKGVVHITGGGFYENIPRILPEGTGVTIDRNSFTVLPIFKVIERMGEVEEKEMFTTFNMGIGMMLFVDPKEEEQLHRVLTECGEKSVTIGEVTSNNVGQVILK